jgi:hypothetical protein
MESTVRRGAFPTAGRTVLVGALGAALASSCSSSPPSGAGSTGDVGSGGNPPPAPAQCASWSDQGFDWCECYGPGTTIYATEQKDYTKGTSTIVPSCSAVYPCCCAAIDCTGCVPDECLCTTLPLTETGGQTFDTCSSWCSFLGSGPAQQGAGDGSVVTSCTPSTVGGGSGGSGTSSSSTSGGSGAGGGTTGSGTEVVSGMGGVSLQTMETPMIPIGETLTPLSYHVSQGMNWVSFALDGAAWPNSTFSLVDTSWTLITTGSIQCTLSGMGGNGPASAMFSGGSTLGAGPYHVSQGITFMGFTLNGAPWPSASWAVDQTSWSIRCQ